MPSPAPDRDPPRRGRPTLTVSAGAVSVTFSWVADRWRHEIRVADRVIAASVENAAGDQDSAWPASPPLVELAPLDTPRGPAVLGVGMAGRSHFSASIAPHDDEPDAVVFEIACRIKDAPAWLGSTYDIEGSLVRVAAPTACEPLPTTIRWTYTFRPAGIEPVGPATLRHAR